MSDESNTTHTAAPTTGQPSPDAERQPQTEEEREQAYREKVERGPEYPLSQGYDQSASQVQVTYHNPGAALNSEQDRENQEVLQDTAEEVQELEEERAARRSTVTVDTRTPELNYATRDNIVVDTGNPGVVPEAVAQIAADQLGQDVALSTSETSDWDGPQVTVAHDAAALRVESEPENEDVDATDPEDPVVFSPQTDDDEDDEPGDEDDTE